MLKKKKSCKVKDKNIGVLQEILKEEAEKED